MNHRDPRNVCRMLGMRDTNWPKDWPLPTGPQYVMLRVLIGHRPSSFLAAVDVETGVYRVIVFNDQGFARRRRPIAREYALLLDGRMRHVQAGEPYVEEETRVA